MKIKLNKQMVQDGRRRAGKRGSTYPEEEAGVKRYWADSSGEELEEDYVRVSRAEKMKDCKCSHPGVLGRYR